MCICQRNIKTVKNNWKASSNKKLPFVVDKCRDGRVVQLLEIERVAFNSQGTGGAKLLSNYMEQKYGPRVVILALDRSRKKKSTLVRSLPQLPKKIIIRCIKLTRKVGA